MPPAASAVDPWDDWESEDYGRGIAQSDEASSNARLWQVANNSLSLGPSAVHSGQSGTLYNPYTYDSSSSTSSPAPPAAFVPSLKILKRPTNTPGSSASGSQAARDLQKKSLKDRERAYNEARNRIFGAASASTPSSNPPSGSSSPKSGALSPSMTATLPLDEAQNLAASVSGLSLDAENQKSVEDRSSQGNTSSTSLDRTSNPGKQRIPSRAEGSTTSSTHASSRPSTPSATIIREPVGPPSSAEKNSSAKVQMQARGFSKTKKQKILSPVAAAFVPVSFAPKMESKPESKPKKKSQQGINTR